MDWIGLACDVAGSYAMWLRVSAARTTPSNNVIFLDRIFGSTSLTHKLAVLEHYLRSKARDPTIRGVIILPKWPSRP
jgi:hypothetical protein